jgi:amidohydrolase
VTENNVGLTEQMMPSIRRAVGADRVGLAPMVTGSEDFSYFQEKVPGVFLFLGVTPRDQDYKKAAQNHSPYFFADESALPAGVRTLSSLALDFLTGPPHRCRRAPGLLERLGGDENPPPAEAGTRGWPT